MQLAFADFNLAPEPAALSEPEAYRGLYAFHKYWGKKPAEPIRYLIQHLCPPNGLVVDPFLGSGISALEAIQLRRRIIGIDVNPAAIRLSRMLVSPPKMKHLEKALHDIATMIKSTILDSYITAEGKFATHYVWRAQTLQKVWIAPAEGRTRTELPPTPHDFALVETFASYRPQRLRSPRFFQNSRINATPCLKLLDLFTGRALRNIELLLDTIGQQPSAVQEALKLCLTASVGQMSKMVFAITGRGKNSGRHPGRMEVGSWVIGYWRPEQHFEINVWNCFERRAQKLLKAVHEVPSALSPAKPGDLASVCSSAADYALISGDTLNVLPTLPDSAVSLIVTDPPHSDRIPYLELSELWNVMLGECPSFESEIVVSNAKERRKNKAGYNEAMTKFLEISGRKLAPHGFLVMFFNARTEASWRFFEDFAASADSAGLSYAGCFPLVYSAASVVQDNRDGALRTDYGIVFSRSGWAPSSLADIPGWSRTMPIPQN